MPTHSSEMHGESRNSHSLPPISHILKQWDRDDALGGDDAHDVPQNSHQTFRLPKLPIHISSPPLPQAHPPYQPLSPAMSESSTVFSRSSSLSAGQPAPYPSRVTKHGQSKSKKKAGKNKGGKSDLPVRCGICHDWNCNDARHSKSFKERKARKVQQHPLQSIEDLLELLGGMDNARFKTQSSGNGCSSGLRFSKADTLNVFLAVSLMLTRNCHEQAIRDDREKEFFGFIRGITDDYIASSNPLQNTWLEGHPDDQPCEHHDRENACYVHDHQDWMECRKERHKRNFDNHRRSFVIRAGVDRAGGGPSQASTAF